MNHVPDEVLDAIDDLGERLLLGEPTTVEKQLRNDLRLRVECDETALDTGDAPVVFRLEHTTAADTLRGHGSFVETIVENVETQLRTWGIDPPDEYRHQATDEGWQVYLGQAQLP